MNNQIAGYRTPQQQGIITWDEVYNYNTTRSTAVDEDTEDVPAEWIPGIHELIATTDLSNVSKVRMIALELAMSYCHQFKKNENVPPSAVINAARKFEQYILHWEQDAMDNLAKGG